MKYTIVFIHNGTKKRTVVEADSEFYARRKLINKASGIVIESCKIVNEGQNIMDFLNRFSK